MTIAAGALRRRALLALIVGFAIGLPLLASAARERGAREEPIGSRGSAELLRAIELPRSAQDARAAGLSEASLRETLDALQAHGVTAADAGAVFVAWVRLGNAAASTPLATIVRERLAAGVRGPALAEALRASTHDPGTMVQTPQRPPLQVPRDSAGERRPISDTAKLRPPTGVRPDTLRDTARVIPPGSRTGARP